MVDRVCTSAVDMVRLHTLPFACMHAYSQGRTSSPGGGVFPKSRSRCSAYSQKSNIASCRICSTDHLSTLLSKLHHLFGLVRHLQTGRTN